MREGARDKDHNDYDKDDKDEDNEDEHADEFQYHRRSRTMIMKDEDNKGRGQ